MEHNNKATLLLVEDDAPQRMMLAGFLKKLGYLVVEADSAASAILRADEDTVDLLISDLRLGGPDGVSLLLSLRKRRPDLQAIVLTAYATVEDAVRAMRAGAYDFLNKPVDLSRLEALIEKALEKANLARENRTLIELVQNSDAFSALIGDSEAMRRIKQVGARVAASKSSVLILGESGTGKEVLARAIHRAGPRAGRAFVTVNCAALPENLIESELFGHEKGAFTGADNRRKGRFETANGGTLFLDEVGDIPLPVQVKLLNVLQSGSFERVGGNENISSDVRIIAATNRNLEQRIKDGLFREDLFYRLNVVPLTMPALRDRLDDIPLLAAHFIEKYSAWSDSSKVRTMSPEALERLMRHGFPGNVRELENWIERALVLAEGERLEVEDFPPATETNAANAADISGNNFGLEAELEEFEESRIRAALAASGGNQSAAARLLKIPERNIRYKMKKYGL